MGNGDTEGRGFRIPEVVAVALWFGAALAVAGYTVLSYIETASGEPTINASPPGGAPVKKLTTYGISPKDIGIKNTGPGGPALSAPSKTYAINPASLGFRRPKFTPSRGADRRGKYGNQK